MTKLFAQTVVGLTGLVTPLLLQGCGSGVGEAANAPDVETNAVEDQNTITHTNGDGTWTATAQQPISKTQTQYRASALFTGPSGKKRLMGLCAVERDALSPVPCATVATCTAIPPGGSAYCAAENGVGTKYCWYRQGLAAAFCAGTPALPWANPSTGVTCTTPTPPTPTATCAPQKVAPGTYTTPNVTFATNRYVMSYACFEGCTQIDPSASSTKISFMPSGTFTLNLGSNQTLVNDNYNVGTTPTIDIILDQVDTYTWDNTGSCSTWQTWNNGKSIRCVKQPSGAPAILRVTQGSTGITRSLYFWPWPS